MPFRLMCREDWKRVVEYVRMLPWERDGKRLMYRVKIEELKPKRTLEQNDRYWALLTDISQKATSYMGGEWHSPEAWHEYCKRRFLGVEPGPFGNGVPKSTKKLGMGPFSDYMTEIEVWAGEYFPGWTFDYQERTAA